MDNNSGCNKCGLLPQQPVKPCKPVCKCHPKKRLCKPKECCEKLSIYSVPANLGDDMNGEYAAVNGLFKSMLVNYEANGTKYFFDSDGAYMKL